VVVLVEESIAEDVRIIKGYKRFGKVGDVFHGSCDVVVGR
jgi:hypothetical protein